MKAASLCQSVFAAGLFILAHAPRLGILAAVALLTFASAHGADSTDHPRLFLSPAIISKLREQITSDPNYRKLWEKTLKEAEILVARPAKHQGLGYDSKSARFEGDLPHIGDEVALLAFVYAIGGDKKYLAASLQYIEAILTYSPWGIRPINRDRPAGHLLAGLGLAYDWLYHELDPNLRERVKEALLTHERLLYEGGMGAQPTDWRDEYLGNHQRVALAGLMTAALAIKGEKGIDDKEVDAWLKMAKYDLTLSETLMSPDGASQEGVNYWSYGVERLLRCMDLARDHLGLDLFHPSGEAEPAWWQNAPLYRGYLSLPRNAWTRRGPGGYVVDFADMNLRTEYFSPFVLHKLAKEYKDPIAQQLADDEASGIDYGGGDCWLDLLWSDFSVPKKPFTDFSTFHLFENMGIVISRSSWNGDESLLGFKCGPPIGHDAISKNKEDGGERYLKYFGNAGGHTHPDAGTFFLFGAGQWLIRTSGYAQNGKHTKYENTLTIDGEGQFGEGDVWLDAKPAIEADPTITVVQTGDFYDYVVGDATTSYEPKFGLTRFQRHLLYFKKINVVLILDDVQLRRPAALALNFHFENVPTVEHSAKGIADIWQAQDPVKKSTFRLAEFDLEALSKCEVNSFPWHAAGTVSLPYVAIERPASSSWQNAVALSWVAGDKAPPAVNATHTAGSSVWVFNISDGVKPVTVTLDIANRSVKESE